MKPLVSIIVPVYKVEAYLEKCVNSIISQTYENIEVILVNDGSPDNCGEICEECANKDTRIKVVHKENGGLSDARNVGIDNSTGDYICFVDSDDFLEINYVEKLVNAAMLNKADLVISNFKYVYEDGTVKSYEFKHEVKTYAADEIIELLVENNMSVPFVVAWSKLYSKELFVSLRFKKGIIHEDEEICYKLIDRSNKIVVIEDVLYNYVQRAGSIMNATNLQKKLVLCDIFKERYEYLLSHKYSERACQLSLINYFHCLNKFIYLCKVHNNKEMHVELTRRMKNLVKSSEYKNLKVTKRIKLSAKRTLVKLNLVGLVYGVLKRSDFNG